MVAPGSFRTLSSSSDRSSSSSNSAAEVEAILAEAADLVALEHIARLNTAHLPPDSLLPPDLETRFRRLATFPAAAAAAAAVSTPRPLKSVKREEKEGEKEEKEEEEEREDKGDLLSATAKSSDGGGFSGGFSSSPSPSPPRRRACCLTFMAKEEEKESGTFSRRRLRSLMKKVKGEELKVLNEVKEMTRRIKQASARMAAFSTAAAVDEVLSDLEDGGAAKKAAHLRHPRVSRK